MRAGLVQLVVAVALASGCRGLTKQAALPTKHRMEVDQLIFQSDFELSADDPLVRELRAERGEICRTLGLPCSDEPIEVYLFRDAEVYGKFLSRHFPQVPTRRAFFLETDKSLAVYAHFSDRVAEDLRHEVAHGYLHAVVPAVPLWLDEGLAEYFEVPRGHGGLNRPHVQLLSDMQNLDGWRPNLKKLEQLSAAAQMKQPDYAESWAWVYFLLHSSPETREQLTAYLTDVRSSDKVEPLSMRLASLQNQPESALSEFLASLQTPQGNVGQVPRERPQ